MSLNRVSGRKVHPLIVLSLLLSGLLFWACPRPGIQAGALDTINSPDLARSPAADVFFSGVVSYDPAGGAVRVQSEVPVTLFGIDDRGGLMELDSATTAADGSYRLAAVDPVFDSLQIVVGNPRGFVPGAAHAPVQGVALDPNTIAFPGDILGDVGGTDFALHDPLVAYPIVHSRYLIVTRDELVSALDDFIAYKQSQGFEVIVETVENLDPLAKGDDLPTLIRNREIGLWLGEGSLKYVLMVGSHDTIPYLLVSAASPDRSRLPQDGAWEWDGKCGSYGSSDPNVCGRATDWYYVDLVSDWDTNGDGVLGEAFWATPEKLQEWKDDNVLPGDFVPDAPPEFWTNVYVGRLQLESPAAVKVALQAIMDFERDGGAWKHNTLLAGAMASVGGRTWDNKEAKYVDLPAPTDFGFLMEEVWSNILEPGGYSRLRLYEKESPYGALPPRTSSFPVEDPLLPATFLDRWTSEAHGLVKIAGHGSPFAIYRRYWREDYNANAIPEEIISPDEEVSSHFELSDLPFVAAETLTTLSLPGGKLPVVIALSCSTAAWQSSTNFAASLQAGGNIAAWIGGTDKLYYRAGWRTPFGPTGGKGATIDYLITDALIGNGLPLGEAVWSGLKAFYSWSDGPNWEGKSVNLGILSWDLFGDPSMGYWGDGPNLVAPWPMYGYDWPGRGETALLGPDVQDATTVQLNWSRPISATADGDSQPSPVIDVDGRVVIGDGAGVVHSVGANGDELWSFATGGPIVNAAALSADGRVYVKAEDGLLYAISRSGDFLWSAVVGESKGSPKVGRDGTVFVGGSDLGGPGGSQRFFLAAYRPDGQRLAISEVDGRVTTAPMIEKDGRAAWVGTEVGTLYHMQVGHAYTSTAITPGWALGDGLAYSQEDRILVISSANGSLIGFDTLASTPVWTYTVGGGITAAPALGANGQVFAGSGDGFLYALDSSDGSLLWSYDTGGPIDSAPALDPVNVFVVGGDPPAVLALRRSSGALRWSLPLGGDAGGNSSPAIGHSRTLYVASQDALGGPTVAVLNSIGPHGWAIPAIVYETTVRPGEIELGIQVGDPFSSIQVERRLPGGDWSVQDTLMPGAASFVDSAVDAGQVYNYRLLSVPTAGPRSASAGLDLATEPSDYSAAVTVQALPDPPGQPPAPAVTARSATELQLTWELVITDAVTVEVLRQGPAEAISTTLTALPGGATEFFDGELQPSSVYTYWLQAHNAAGASLPGEPGQGHTFARTLPAPIAVTVEPLDYMTFQVCWTPGDPGLPAVVARRMDGELDPEHVATVDAGETCFRDDNASFFMHAYWVKHRDLDGKNESEWTKSSLTAPPGFDLGYNRVYLPLTLRD